MFNNPQKKNKTRFLKKNVRKAKKFEKILENQINRHTIKNKILFNIAIILFNN